MKHHLSSKTNCLVASILGCLFLITDTAQAEQQFVHLSNDTRETYIWCAIIIALGMIISAAILRRPK